MRFRYAKFLHTANKREEARSRRRLSLTQCREIGLFSRRGRGLGATRMTKNPLVRCSLIGRRSKTKGNTAREGKKKEEKKNRVVNLRRFRSSRLFSAVAWEIERGWRERVNQRARGRVGGRRNKGNRRRGISALYFRGRRVAALLSDGGSRT